MRKNLIFRDRRVGAFAFGQRIYEQKSQNFYPNAKALTDKRRYKRPIFYPPRRDIASATPKRYWIRNAEAILDPQR